MALDAFRSLSKLAAILSIVAFLFEVPNVWAQSHPSAPQGDPAETSPAEEPLPPVNSPKEVIDTEVPESEPAEPMLRQNPSLDSDSTDPSVSPQPPAQLARESQAPSLTHRDATFWDLHSPEEHADSLALLRKGLHQALAGEKGQHFFEPSELADALAQAPAQVPDCFLGLEPCMSAPAVAFDLLGVSSLVSVHLDSISLSASPQAQWSANYQMRDRLGRVVRERSLQAPSVRQLAFELVRDIYDATGEISVRSQPSGAIVTIDGVERGVTPLNQRLPIGQYQFTLSAPDYQKMEGTFEVTTATTSKIYRELSSLPGLLVLRDVPPQTEVFWQGRSLGTTESPLQLPAGMHPIELRAPGYQPHAITVEIQPGLTTRTSASLSRQNPLLRDIPEAAIASLPLIARINYEHTFQSTSFRGGRTAGDGRALEFRRFATEPDSAELEITRRSVDPNGMRLEFAYHGRNFGLTALSLSYLTTGIGALADVEDGASGDILRVEVDRVRRLELRPFQVSYRMLYQNLVPRIEAGVGVNFQWIDISGAELPTGEDTLSQAEAFWTLGLYGEYYVTEHFFAYARYGIQDYFNAGLGLEHLLGLGMGGAFPNFFFPNKKPPSTLPESAHRSKP